MKHAIPHDLGFDLAKKATERAFTGYLERFADFDPTATWVTNERAEIAFKAKGIRLAGAVTVGAEAIDLELDVPFLFKPFQGKAMAIIEEQIRLWVDKAKAGALAP